MSTNIGTAPHGECHHVGKFDCSFDEAVYDHTMVSGEGEGDVESPVGWWHEIVLELGEIKEREHYGTPHLLARENSQGFFWVERYETDAFLTERIESLRAGYAEWDMDVLS